MTASQQAVIIVGVHHDLARKQSVARLVWDGEPEKGLSLPVPFGCALADLPDAAEKAVRALSGELAVIPVRSA